MCLVLRIITFILCSGQIWNPGASSSFEYLGCFSGSSLVGTQDHSLFPFNPLKCFELCKGHDCPFVRIASNSSICHCGRRLSSRPKKEKDSLCQPCLQERHISCGGNETSSLYRVTLPKLPDNTEVEIILGLEGAITELHTLLRSEVTLEITTDTDIVVEAVDVHINRHEFYASWDYHIHRFSFDNNGSVTEVVYMVGSCKPSVFALDWVHDHFFWANCRMNSIMMSDLDGDNTETLVRMPNYHIRVGGIVVDPYRGMLFWIVNDGFELMSCELDGRNLSVVVRKSSFDSMSSLALDMVNRVIYFSGEDGGSAVVFQVQYDGSGFRRVFSQPSEQPILGFGVIRSRLYFFSYVPHNNQTALFKVDFTDNEMQDNVTQKLQDLKKSSITAKKLIHPMKIVRSELQSPGIIDDCIWRGCSYHCVVRNSAATCLCPRKYDLGVDGITCTKRPEDRMVYKVLGALGCVVLVLLTSGVLMCMVDKLWSHVHPTVVRVTRQMPLRRSPIVRRSVDSDNSSLQ